MAKIIAEICQNHKGGRALLARMIAAAAENGADYVKMQSIFSEDLTNRPQFEEGEIAPDGAVRAIKRPYAPEYARLKELDLSLDDHQFFIKECKRNSVVPFTTIFARGRIPEIAALPWPERIVKVASYDCPNIPFLRELCEHFDHLIISTGASYDEEIERAAAFVKGMGKKLTMLHCVTSYPNTLQMANLKRLEWIRNHAGEVGWSDHTLVARDRLIAAKAALALGADFVERHFTVLTVGETKDGPVSITPELLRELSDFRNLTRTEQEQTLDVEYPRWREEVLGDEKRELTHTEKLNRDYYRGRFASRRADGSYFYNWEEK
ncbi:MAG: N-acetylneuraminate synthase family protein [bacterium]|nr:N-acetylneuraminate synthase family protein [bacterium]